MIIVSLQNVTVHLNETVKVQKAYCFRTSTLQQLQDIVINLEHVVKSK